MSRPYLIIMALLVAAVVLFLVMEDDQKPAGPTTETHTVKTTADIPTLDREITDTERVEINTSEVDSPTEGASEEAGRKLRFLIRYRDSGEAVTGGNLVLSDDPISLDWNHWVEIDHTGHAEFDTEPDMEIVRIAWEAQDDYDLWHGFAPGQIPFSKKTTASTDTGEFVVEVDTGEVLVHGRILDASTGQPISDASIPFEFIAAESESYSFSNDAYVTSDREGRYEIAGLTARSFPADATWDLDATHPDYLPYHGSLKRAPGQNVLRQDITMHPGIRVRGHVIDEAGAPITNCTVELTTLRTAEGDDPEKIMDVARNWTSQGSEFSFEAVRPGDEIELEAWTANHPKQKMRMTIAGQEEVYVTLRLTRGVRFEVVVTDDWGETPDQSANSEGGSTPFQRKTAVFLRSANGEVTGSYRMTREGHEFCTFPGTTLTAVAILMTTEGNSTTVRRGEKTFTTHDGLRRIEVIASELLDRPPPPREGVPLWGMGVKGPLESVAAYYRIDVLDAKGEPYVGTFLIEVPLSGKLTQHLKDGRVFLSLPPGRHRLRYMAGPHHTGGIELTGGENEIQEMTIQFDE